MPSLGSSTVSVRANTTQFNRQMLQASNRMRRFGRSARAAAGQVARVFAGFALGGGALGAGVKALSDSATSLRELAIATDISVPRLQTLQRVFQADGLEAEKFRKSILRLQRSIGDAAGGEIEYLESFQELGVALRDSNGQIRSTDDVLEEILPKLAQLPRALQASFGADFFGRGFENMATAMARLNDDSGAFTREIERQSALLPNLTTDTAAELKRVNQSFTDAGNAAETYGQLLVAAFSNEIVGAISNSLRSIRDNADQITGTLKVIAANADLIATGGLIFAFRSLAIRIGAATLAIVKFGIAVAAVSVRQFAISIGLVAASAAKSVVSLSAMVTAMRAFGAAMLVAIKPIGLAVAGLAALVFAVQYAQEALEGNFLGFDAALEDTIEVFESGYNRISDLVAAGIDPISLEGTVDTDAFTGQFQSARDQVQAQANAGPVEITIRAQTFGLDNQIEALSRQRDLLQVTGDAAVRLAARQDFLKNVNAELNTTYAALNRSQQRLAEGGFELTRVETAELNDEIAALQARIQELNSIAINPEIANDSIDRISELSTEIADLQQRQQLAGQASQVFVNSFQGVLTGAQDAKEAVRSFIGQLANLVLQYLVLIPLAQSLSGAISGAFGLAGGGIGTAATGGFRRGLTLVGERGPELVDLGSGSQVYSNEQLNAAVAGGGAGVIVNNTFNIESSDGPGVQRALAEALPAIVDASTNKILNESVRPGAVRTTLRGY